MPPSRRPRKVREIQHSNPSNCPEKLGAPERSACPPSAPCASRHDHHVTMRSLANLLVVARRLLRQQVKLHEAAEALALPRATPWQRPMSSRAAAASRRPTSRCPTRSRRATCPPKGNRRLWRQIRRPCSRPRLVAGAGAVVGVVGRNLRLLRRLLVAVGAVEARAAEAEGSSRHSRRVRTAPRSSSGPTRTRTCSRLAWRGTATSFQSWAQSSPGCRGRHPDKPASRSTRWHLEMRTSPPPATRGLDVRPIAALPFADRPRRSAWERFFESPP